MSKKDRDGKRRDRFERRPLKPTIEWPSPLGYSLTPMHTGLGGAPRNISDEDWIALFEDTVKTDGLKQTIVNFLEALRRSADMWNGAPGPLQAYPQLKVSRRLPVANMAMPGERGGGEPLVSKGEFTEEVIRGMLVNPVYAGVAGCPAIIDDELWVKAVERAIELGGLDQTLVNILHALKKTFGQPGSPGKYVPLGYRP